MEYNCLDKWHRFLNIEKKIDDAERFSRIVQCKIRTFGDEWVVATSNYWHFGQYLWSPSCCKSGTMIKQSLHKKPLGNSCEIDSVIPQPPQSVRPVQLMHNRSTNGLIQAMANTSAHCTLSKQIISDIQAVSFYNKLNSVSVTRSNFSLWYFHVPLSGRT